MYTMNRSLLFFVDRGTVQKVIVLPKDTSTTEELTLEEVEMFRVMTIITISRKSLSRMN